MANCFVHVHRFTFVQASDIFFVCVFSFSFWCVSSLIVIGKFFFSSSSFWLVIVVSLTLATIECTHLHVWHRANCVCTFHAELTRNTCVELIDFLAVASNGLNVLRRRTMQICPDDALCKWAVDAKPLTLTQKECHVHRPVFTWMGVIVSSGHNVILTINQKCESLNCRFIYIPQTDVNDKR